ncbi:nucleotidyltransferase family protein [Bradyrhizobium japonicum]|uniref:nucleotidyltransferase family protein n=1 Tax=Bradyrhizobium japonicum TaxID=375 RepID=UPI0027147DC7|nr:nucleotidyltransferase domain-containing protein [Bradyrhizobium japonicum]WLB57474.1 nucleotidyltransferase domain-containing protein [Bradyrhizobium japonicum]WLB60660.1 nucleotidyltransferase domain-containing protein [Bradyrhizobium japonicum]
MDMREEWLRDLAGWTSNNGSIRELWLFGSRADDTARPDSDVDLGLGLTAPVGDHDWARGNYYALGDQWQRELEAIVGRHVSLEAITPDEPGRAVVRKWVLLWRRDDEVKTENR